MRASAPMCMNPACHLRIAMLAKGGRKPRKATPSTMDSMAKDGPTRWIQWIAFKMDAWATLGSRRKTYTADQVTYSHSGIARGWITTLVITKTAGSRRAPSWRGLRLLCEAFGHA